jgi:hypothetical protein
MAVDMWTTLRVAHISTATTTAIKLLIQSKDKTGRWLTAIAQITNVHRTHQTTSAHLESQLS